VRGSWFINFPFGFYENFGIFVSEGKFMSLNQLTCYIAKRKERNHRGVEAM